VRGVQAATSPAQLHYYLQKAVELEHNADIRIMPHRMSDPRNLVAFRCGCTA